MALSRRQRSLALIRWAASVNEFAAPNLGDFMQNLGFTVSSPMLIAREDKDFNDVFEYSEFLIDTVRKFVPADAINPGLEYHPSLLALESSAECFASGDAIGAFTRTSMSRPSEVLDVEADKVKRLVNLIAQNTPTESLKNRCVDMSCLVTGMLQHMGVWAITYRGTLLYVSPEGQVIDRLDYVSDILSPPPSSNVARGHSWIFTASIPVIDLTAKFQPLPPSVTNPLPKVVLSRDERAPRVLSGLYYDHSGAAHYIRKAKEYLSQRRIWPEWNRLHKPVEVPGPIILRYLPMDIAIPEEQIFDNPKYAKGIEIGGVSPWEFFEQHRAELER